MLYADTVPVELPYYLSDGRQVKDYGIWRAHYILCWAVVRFRLGWTSVMSMRLEGSSGREDDSYEEKVFLSNKVGHIAVHR